MILKVMQTILLRQILAQLAGAPLTVANAANDLRANYAGVARQVADRLALLEKTQAAADAEAAAAATLAADSVLWSTEVNAALQPGARVTAARVDGVWLACPDPARKGRWTAAQVRALFGL